MKVLGTILGLSGGLVGAYLGFSVAIAHMPALIVSEPRVSLKPLSIDLKEGVRSGLIVTKNPRTLVFPNTQPQRAASIQGTVGVD